MKKTLLPALLATAMIPMVAVAQTTPAPDAPATDAPATDSATPPAGGMEATPPAGGMEATPPAGGTMGTDAPSASEPMGTSATDAPAGDMAASGSAVEGPFVTVPPTGAWRVTDLNGKSVEDAAGESIGSISDVLVDENGEVIAVLVGVGGFLGIGAKDVAVAMDALEFGPGSMEGLSTAPAADAAPAAPAGGMTADPAAAPATDAAPATPVVGEDNLPDRIVLAVTREELEAAPAYGEPETGETDAGTGGMAPAPAQ